MSDLNSDKKTFHDKERDEKNDVLEQPETNSQKESPVKSTPKKATK